MKRALILPAAVVMQLCMGATYTWSVFVTPLKEQAGLDQAAVQLPYSLFYFAFPATVIVAGVWLLPRFGPRVCAMAGGAIFGAGWLLASLGAAGFGWTILGVGLLSGIGVGLAYLAPIAVGMQWFPRRKGLVTGVAVVGFGGGAALIGFLAERLMAGDGRSPFEVFAVLGAVFLVLTVPAAAQLRPAPGHESREPSPVRPGRVIRRRDFRALYLAMLIGLAAGFAVNANLRQLPGRAGAALGETAGVTAVACFAVANALGRLAWGWLADRVRSSVTLRANLLVQGGVLLVAPWIVGSQAGLLAVASLAGFNYGGVLVVYAAAVARIWGPAQVAPVYGLLFSANILAGLAPVAAGAWFDLRGDFGLALAILAVLLAAGALLVRGHRGELDAAGDG